MGRYRVNDIFYSIQGEGCWTGTPMVFLRLSGCNLHCPFCDTDFSASSELDESEIIKRLKEVSPDCTALCITGGEPSLQLDDGLVSALHDAGYRIHVETNGTRPLPAGIDWITLSPKEDFAPRGNVTSARVVLQRADELKLVYNGKNDPEKWEDFPALHHYLQPCDMTENCPADGDDPTASEGSFVRAASSPDTVALSLRYILSHPRWRLSLQTHKILGIA